MRNGPKMMGMKLLFGAVAALVISAMGAWPAAAQQVPVPLVQEVLIKATLMTFNDANITGNYDVLHAKLSKPFRDQFPPEKLKEAFKVFADNHVDFEIVTAKAPIAKQEPAVTDKACCSSTATSTRRRATSTTSSNTSCRTASGSRSGSM